jgi:hypothetical protein
MVGTGEGREEREREKGDKKKGQLLFVYRKTSKF